MPNNKRQHYVPKHMLRRFATDAEARRVALYHLGSKRVVRGASLKEQCYKDYYHGADLQVEYALSKLERVDSKFVDTVIENECLPPHNVSHVPIMFSLQRSRTLSSSETLDAITDAFSKLTLFGRADEKELRSIRINFENSANFSVSTALSVAPILYDMKQILILNRSRTPFLLSDNPVIATNWFCRTRYPDRSGTGTSSAGLQMLLPIAPNLAILLIDSNIYSLDGRGGQHEISRCSDIQALNRLQFLSAKSTLYLPPGYSDEQLASVVATSRTEDRPFVFQRLESTGDNASYKLTNKDEYAAPSPEAHSEIVRIGGRQPPADIRFPGLSIRSKPAFFDDGSMASPTRDPIWTRIVHDFAEALSTQTMAFDDFADFVGAHRLEPRIGPWRQKAAARALRQKR
jgi:hypothetical protein